MAEEEIRTETKPGSLEGLAFSCENLIGEILDNNTVDAIDATKKEKISSEKELLLNQIKNGKYDDKTLLSNFKLFMTKIIFEKIKVSQGNVEPSEIKPYAKIRLHIRECFFLLFDLEDFFCDDFDVFPLEKFSEDNNLDELKKTVSIIESNYNL